MLHHTSSVAALLERLPPEPHLRGKEFERAAKWFLETDPAYASELREVWLWDGWPGNWGPDNGIDLVAENPGRQAVGYPGQMLRPRESGPY